MTKEKKAPFFIPTLFVNHKHREKYVKERDKICPLRLPENCVDAYDLFNSVNEDILDSFKRKFFLKHSRGCAFLFLKKEFSTECAIKEALMPRPFFYSKNIDVKLKSKCIDPDYQKRSHPRICDIEDHSICFIVEFCVIYPEDKVSTVIVSCAICGRVVETVLDKSTTIILKKELMEYTMSLNIETDEPQRFQAVIPLPDDMIYKPGDLTFLEGIVGVTPLTSATPFKPSVFMRVRIKFVTHSKCIIVRSIHESQEEEELYPDYTENI